jgi:uroporphyrinogen decarboxylase
MLGVERVKAAFKSEATDVPPVLMLTSTHSCSIVKETIPHIRADSEVNFKAQIKLLELYEYDNVFQYWDPAMFWDAMGLPVKLLDDCAASIVDGAIKEPADLNRLEYPNIDHDSTLRQSVLAVEKLSKAVGNRVAVSSGVFGPFTYASMLRGIEKFMIDLIKNPDSVPPIIEWALNSQIHYARIVKGAGAFYVNVSDPLASFLSRAMFDRFVQPYHQRLFEALRSMDLYSTLHICGNASQILSGMVKASPSCIWIDQNNPIPNSKSIANKICVMGNIDPVAIILQGKPSDVERETLRCLKEGGDRGFIVSGGCDTPTYTNPENIKTLIRTARNYNAN